MPAPKTYKPKKCEAKDCGDLFVPVRFNQKACSLPCAVKVAAQKRDKTARQTWGKEKRAIKEKLKKKSDWEKELQVLINKLVRLLDSGHACISGGKTYGQMQAGHYYGTLSHPSIRFHLMNIYAQTAQENNNKSGNPIGYREGLISTFGIEHMEYVESLKAHPPIKLSVDDLKEKIRIARECVKDMEVKLYSNDGQISTEGRINLRKYYNNKLNIYQY